MGLASWATALLLISLARRVPLRRHKPAMVRVALPTLLEATESALVASGLAKPSADIIARGLVGAQRDGRPAHGLERLPGILGSLKSGAIAVEARPTVSRPRPAVLQVDAGQGLALPAISHGLPELARMARELGIACLGVVNAKGFVGPLWIPLERLASEEGLAVLACCNTPALVAPAGGKERCFGTNPIAFAWPRRGQPPMIVDMACSALSRGSMQSAARRGVALPSGCALDAHGRPTTNAADGLAGTQLSMGGAKGAALCLMVELLAAALLGTHTAPEGRAATNAGGMLRGVLLIAFDVNAHYGVHPAGVHQSAERLFAAVRAAGGRLPSDDRYLHRRRSEREDSTIEVPSDLLEECFGTATLEVSRTMRGP